MTAASIPSPLDFFARLHWLDGRPLLDTMEDYRRELHMRALYTFRDDGTPLYNMVLSGRAKKNWKSADLVLAAFYRQLMWQSPFGNDCLILANDEDQAGDDLSLAKKLVACNPNLSGELDPYHKEIRRKDGGGTMRVLPSRDAVGAHGKTALFIGFDEIHGYRNYDIFEALAPDPTRSDVLTWITSYDTIWNGAGVPLVDFKAAGIKGDDPRMLFSWYSGELCTDPALAELPSEERANPSMGSWPEGRAYLDQQRRRLPRHKFRRLHLNLPGAPNGAFLDTDMLMSAIVEGRRVLPFRKDQQYAAFVDMSGGSSDDACLAIAHREGEQRILDLVVSQDGSPPFDPRVAVRKFARILKTYNLTTVTGDAYAGLTYRYDFEAEGIRYVVTPDSKTDIYEALEPEINAGSVELLDIPKLQEQLISLVIRGAKIDHPNGDYHDDFANAAAGALKVCAQRKRGGTTIYRTSGLGEGQVIKIGEIKSGFTVQVNRVTEKEAIARGLI